MLIADARLTVDARYNGPPGTGNGGWTAGLIAAHLPASGATRPVAEVTLRQAPPLDTPLHAVGTYEWLTVQDPDGLLIATARERAQPIGAVAPVSRTEALAASARYPGHGKHHFPTCFVCGPQRADGLRIFPGRLPDGRTAGVFTMPPTPDAATAVTTVWASVDCAGGWAVIEPDQVWLLGRFAVDVEAVPQTDDECVVMGQVLRRDGRKAVVGTTLYGPSGGLLARAEATWIATLPTPDV